MRVLIVADRLSTRGGADWHLLGVIRELRAAGIEVDLAVGARDDAEPPCGVHVVPGLEGRERVAVDLDSLVLQVRPALLHLQNVMNPQVLDWAASGRLPAVITLQDHRVFCPGRGKWVPGSGGAGGKVCEERMRRSPCRGCFDDEAYFESIFALTEERLEAVRRLTCIVLSSYMAGELRAVGVPAIRIHIVPPFVHGLTAVVEDGSPCVLLAGRLVAAKGIAEAIEIWERAKIGLPLVLAGAGPERGRLSPRPGVVLRGWIAHGELAALMRRARALLLPSRWQEPFGIVGLEASSLGVPVVAWRSGGIEEWHPGPLCEWGDLEGMARALREALLSPPARPPASLARFAADRVMAQLLSVYREAVG